MGWDGHRAPRRTHRRGVRSASGIPAGSRRSKPNDRRASAVETDAGRCDGDDPANCHWHAQPQANAASRAAGQPRLNSGLRNLACLVNIARLHFRVWRGRPVSETVSEARPSTLTRRKPARLILMSCGIASPVIAGFTLPMVVLPMCSSSGLKCLSRTGCSQSAAGQYARSKSVSSAFPYPPGRIAAILPGG